MTITDSPLTTICLAHLVLAAITLPQRPSDPLTSCGQCTPCCPSAWPTSWSTHSLWPSHCPNIPLAQFTDPLTPCGHHTVLTSLWPSSLTHSLHVINGLLVVPPSDPCHDPPTPCGHHSVLTSLWPSLLTHCTPCGHHTVLTSLWSSLLTHCIPCGHHTVLTSLWPSLLTHCTFCCPSAWATHSLWPPRCPLTDFKGPHTLCGHHTPIFSLYLTHPPTPCDRPSHSHLLPLPDPSTHSLWPAITLPSSPSTWPIHPLLVTGHHTPIFSLYLTHPPTPCDRPSHFPVIPLAELCKTHTLPQGHHTPFICFCLNHFMGHPMPMIFILTQCASVWTSSWVTSGNTSCSPFQYPSNIIIQNTRLMCFCFYHSKTHPTLMILIVILSHVLQLELFQDPSNPDDPHSHTFPCASAWTVPRLIQCLCLPLFPPPPHPPGRAST